MIFRDWNRDGKKDRRDAHIQYNIYKKIVEEENKRYKGYEDDEEDEDN